MQISHNEVFSCVFVKEIDSSAHLNTNTHSLEIFQFRNIYKYLQSGEGLEVVKSLGVDGGDLVDVQVQLGGLGWDTLTLSHIMLMI